MVKSENFIFDKIKKFLAATNDYTQLCSSIASEHIPKITAEGSF